MRDVEVLKPTSFSLGAPTWGSLIWVLGIIAAVIGALAIVLAVVNGWHHNWLGALVFCAAAAASCLALTVAFVTASRASAIGSKYQLTAALLAIFQSIVALVLIGIGLGLIRA
jgi:hypothetical protein